jgi:hypothetical protein
MIRLFIFVTMIFSIGLAQQTFNITKSSKPNELGTIINGNNGVKEVQEKSNLIPFSSNFQYKKSVEFTSYSDDVPKNYHEVSYSQVLVPFKQTYIMSGERKIIKMNSEKPEPPSNDRTLDPVILTPYPKNK